MSLVPDYAESSNSSSSSDVDSDSEVSKAEEQPRLPSPKLKLPTPNFDGGATDNSEVTKTSVFKNPFTEAENAKEAVLQKHVKMVESKDNVIVINGKKICWNYRKGRCRFGHNCKFAHDSDIQKSKDQLDAEKQIQRTVVCQNQSLPQPSSQELKEIKDESFLQNQQKRKRPGLTQGLVPGKKVMKKYRNQKT